MLHLKSDLKKYAIALPTDVKEITPELLGPLLDDIIVPQYYGIVAMCFASKLSDIAINVNSTKPATAQVVPLLAKACEEDLKSRGLTIGNKIVVTRTSLEMGVALVLTSVITSNAVAAYIKEDESLRKRLISGGDGSKEVVIAQIDQHNHKQKKDFVANKSPMIYMLEFKIIPLNDIAASIPVDAKMIDPFKIVETAAVN